MTMAEERTEALPIDDSALEIIKGRIDPFIYAFSTGTVPNYLKVGDTYRPVDVRLSEWRSVFPDLHQEGDAISAKVDQDTYFRDYSVHQFLETVKARHRLTKSENPAPYFSSEFFEGATESDVAEAVEAIRADHAAGTGQYQFYSTDKPGAVTAVHYPRTENWELRENQRRVVENFRNARQRGRKNMLMYAVMRFGKSFTAMHCALEMEAKLVVIVTAKPQVMDEWKKTVERPLCFEDYEFITTDDLRRCPGIIREVLNRESKPNRAVVFLSLQDLDGDETKARHKGLFKEKVDLLIVDESHFGARAESYGKVIKLSAMPKQKEPVDADAADPNKADKAISELKKSIKAKISLHLSGTPYRIMMSNEFQPEDIIATVQYSDIVEEQRKWYSEHLEEDDFDNPMFGFPQMVRFAFDLNESSRALVKSMEDTGTPFGLSSLFRPKSIEKDEKGDYRLFEHEKEVLDFLRAIDGSGDGQNVFGFLDNERIKKGQMCRHMVFALPFCASCDAMEALISSHLAEFKNLSDYAIVNISGHDQPYAKVEQVKKAIADAEKAGKKTITLTVSRMLTGSTVEEWDTMVFLRESRSAQEYDQAIYRIQSPYVVEGTAEDGKRIRIDKKPQTILVDFDPLRLFLMEETKALVHNGRNGLTGVAELRRRVEGNLALSPIIVLNAKKLEQVQATDLLARITDYSSTRGIMEESTSLPVDLALARITAIKEMLAHQNPIGSKKGFEEPPHLGKKGTDLEGGDEEGGAGVSAGKVPASEESQEADLVERFQRYYSRILSFAFLAVSSEPISTISDIIETMREGENKRIARHLGLEAKILKLFDAKMNPYDKLRLECDIYNINRLANDPSADSTEFAHRAKLAVRKFNSFGEAEVPTPPHVCSQMIESIGWDNIVNTLESGGHILDCASKTGEFALSIVERFVAEDRDVSKIAASIRSIPTSLYTYEFVLKAYRMIGLDESCIAHFTATYMANNPLDDDPDENAKRVARKLRENKPFDKIVYDKRSRDDFDGRSPSV